MLLLSWIQLPPNLLQLKALTEEPAVSCVGDRGGPGRWELV